jgi:chemotaxis protein MotA
MDIATLIGLLCGLGIIGWAIFEQTHGQVIAFYSTDGLLLVLGGSCAATLLSVPLRNFLDLYRVLGKWIFSPETGMEKLILQLVEYSVKARKDGLLALEHEIESSGDPFLVKGLRMVIDGQKPEEVETNLRLELHALGERHRAGKKIFELLGKYAPGYGLTATLIGQVVMFRNMGSDTAAIGRGMAVALLGTLYGAITANLICLPIADKLGIRSSQELLRKELIINGVLGIQSGDSPTVLKTKLISFLDVRSARRIQPA